MSESVKILLWPDPRLKKPSRPVIAFDAALHDLVARMFALMREEKGVGLAAPQVGHNLRLFIMNATGEVGDDRVYINPELSDGQGQEEGEEGCLSLPGLHVNVVRDKSMRIRAFDLTANPIDETQSGFVARIWQHEFDHLNGTLLTDRMGPVAKMANRKLLKELRDRFEDAAPGPALRKTAKSAKSQLSR